MKRFLDNDETMTKIIDEAIVEKFDIAIQLVEDSGTYIVRKAPLKQKESYTENDFSVIGNTDGIATSEFDTRDDAQRFFNDIQILTNKQLTERYPKIWV